MEDALSPLEQSLEKTMASLVAVLRLVLENMQMEQRSLAWRDSLQMEKILSDRAHLLAEMEKKQSHMNGILREMASLSSIDSCHGLENLASLIGPDKIAILVLRDQVLALIVSIESQNVQNRHSYIVQIKPPLVKAKPFAIAVLDPETDVEDAVDVC